MPLALNPPCSPETRVASPAHAVRYLSTPPFRIILNGTAFSPKSPPEHASDQGRSTITCTMILETEIVIQSDRILVSLASSSHGRRAADLLQSESVD